MLNAGAGVGVAGLCLLCRSPQINVTAVDIDEGACSFAEANAARNGVSGHFRAITADLTAPAESLFAKGLAREGYDQLVANPPFHAEGTVRPAPSSSRAAAHIMQDGALEAWIRSLATFAAPKGRLTLIHRPEVLPELLPLLDRRFGAVSFSAVPQGGRAGEPGYSPREEGKAAAGFVSSRDSTLARGGRPLHREGRGGVAAGRSA